MVERFMNIQTYNIFDISDLAPKMTTSKSFYLHPPFLASLCTRFKFYRPNNFGEKKNSDVNKMKSQDGCLKTKLPLCTKFELDRHV